MEISFHLIGPITSSFNPLQPLDNSIPPKIVVNSDANCAETISYLEAADQQPAIINYREKIYNTLFPKDCKSVLDFGCGLGTFIKGLSHHFPAGEYVGIDHNSGVIEYAQKMNHSSNIFFQNKSIDQFFHQNEKKFNTIFFERVLHCLSDEQIVESLDSSLNALEPEGKLIIVTPDFKSQTIYPQSDTTSKVLEYFLAHCTNNPIQPLHIYNLLLERSERQNLKIHQEIYEINTYGFEATEKGLCLNETVEAAIQDKVLDEEIGREWLKTLKDKAEEVVGVSKMYIYTLSK